MRDLGGIISDNGNNGIVMWEALRRGDYETADLLSCGSGYNVTDSERNRYLAKRDGCGVDVDGVLCARKFSKA